MPGQISALESILSLTQVSTWSDYRNYGIGQP
jgi:hypothetical protein